jgi:hypothetical protein
MTMPGYRAEASLYRSSGQYRAALAAGFAPLGGVAVPQQSDLLPFAPISQNPCQRVCAQRGCSAARACCICNGGVPVPNPRFRCGFFCALF